MGVGASTEIQSAARKVLEENRKLRAILRARGVPEAEISAALALSDRPHEEQSAAPALMALLERRWTGDRFLFDDPSIDGHSDSTSLVSQAPTNELTSLKIPSRITQNLSESYSPVSMISSTGSPQNYPDTSTFSMDMMSLPEVKRESVPHYVNYHYDQSRNNPWMFSSGMNYEGDAYHNTTSCVNAANIIRSMHSDVGPELEVDLGCHSPGQDCRVTNPMVFNVMEKYSNHVMGM